MGSEDLGIQMCRVLVQILFILMEVSTRPVASSNKTPVLESQVNWI
jgi:hypothetical protein